MTATTGMLPRIPQRTCGMEIDAGIPEDAIGVAVEQMRPRRCHETTAETLEQTIP